MLILQFYIYNNVSISRGGIDMLYTEKRIDHVHERFGGVGDATIEHYFIESEINDKINLYAKVTLEPGSSFGYHQHSGTSETIVILSGTAEVNDNGTLCILHAGDVTFCPEGCSHSITNPSDSEPLVVQALVAKV